jgi:hypothetical protein
MDLDWSDTGTCVSVGIICGILVAIIGIGSYLLAIHIHDRNTRKTLKRKVPVDWPNGV